MNTGSRPDSAIAAARAAAVAGLIGLAVLGVAWELWLAPTGSGKLALKVVPLLPFLAGLMRHRLRTYRWVSLLVWIYFLEGAVRATSDHGLSAILAGGEIALALWLFAACATYVRLRLRRLAAPIEAPA
jgi:uncharacterized membrane protein